MNVPKRFWSQEVLTAAYLINRLPSRVLNFKSPYEVLKGRKLDLSHLKLFGCVCFVHVQYAHRDKLDPKAVKCIFLLLQMPQILLLGLGFFLHPLSFTLKIYLTILMMNKMNQEGSFQIGTS